MNEYELGLSHFILFAQSLGIGFLIGLERERHEGKIAGVRTFTLIALAGSLSGFIGVLTGGAIAPWILLTLIVASLLVAQFKSPIEEPDTTTVLAAILAFVLGYVLWLGQTFFPAALAIAVTAVLYFREELRDFPRRLSRQDITSFFQFAAVAFILLPILPDQTYGPYKVINPYQVGWLVVLISGLSLAGYVALRLLRGRSGLIVIGLLGGLASTTATTLVYSRHSKHIPHFSRSAATIILLSHLVLFVRIAVVVAVVQHQLLPSMLPWIIGGLAAGVLCLVGLLWHREGIQQPLPELTVSNPTELKTAFSFAVGFSLVLLLSAWMHDVFENAGGYVIAFLSGLTDVDAITVANLKLFSIGSINAETAGRAIVIAFVANLLFKLGIVFTAADRSLWRPVILGFTVLLAGVLAGLLLF
jgi:uncharacterized membrane protein (DUF4010 family)